MDGSLYIALLNPAIGLVLATAFLAFWLYQRQRRHLALLALGYAASAGGFFLQQFTPLHMFAMAKFVANILFVAALICILSAVLDRYGKPPPIIAFGVLAVGGLAAWAWFMFADPDLVWRIYVLNFALGGISLVTAAEFRTVSRKTVIEPLLLALMVLAGLNFFGRALAIQTTETYTTLYSSVYWTTTMLSHAVASVAVAMILIASTAVDLVGELRNESQTDALSGLLNRRGFEERASKILAETRRKGLPVSLVICDLDHFKAINDSFGHACGDRVIANAGNFFSRAVSAHHAAGRIGGEEFAIILAGTNLVAARLFAEGARSAFTMLAIDGLPGKRPITASFGVAELGEGEESIAELLARADAALYAAKRSGRDCVRVAWPSFTLPGKGSTGSR